MSGNDCFTPADAHAQLENSLKNIPPRLKQQLNINAALLSDGTEVSVFWDTPTRAAFAAEVAKEWGWNARTSGHYLIVSMPQTNQ